MSSHPLLSPVLDRLIDEDPAIAREPYKSRSEVLAGMRRAVRRDLEHLLNTRRRPLTPVEGLDQIEESVITYGLPDIAAQNLGSAHGRAALVRELERTIRRFEPRFASVKVEVVGNASQIDRTLRFRINALLRAHPAPEPVVFDSAYEPDSGAFEVKGG